MKIFGLGIAEFGVLGMALFLIWLYFFSIKKTMFRESGGKFYWLWLLQGILIQALLCLFKIEWVKIKNHFH